MMSKLKKILLGLLLITFFFGISGCSEGPMERAGKAVDEAVEDTGEALEDAGEKVEDAVEEHEDAKEKNK